MVGEVERCTFPNTKIVKISEICKIIRELSRGGSNSGMLK